MTKLPVVEANYCILCDDVREENNGKGLFVGVYTGTVESRQDPFEGRFACAIQLQVNALGSFPLVFTTYFNGEERDTFGGDFHAEETGTSFITIPAEFGILAGSGALTITMTAGESEPVTLLSKEFNQRLDN